MPIVAAEPGGERAEIAMARPLCDLPARAGLMLVASNALTQWRSSGLDRLAELEAVHANLTGSGPSRRWGTTQLNRSLLLALVAQFQSFSRTSTTRWCRCTSKRRTLAGVSEPLVTTFTGTPA